MTHHVGATEVLHVVPLVRAKLCLPTRTLRSPRRAVSALCERINAGRPLAHGADEGGYSRAAMTKWYKRWLAQGEAGLLDRTSRPERQPTRTPDDIEEMVIQLRVAEKWGSRPDRRTPGHGRRRVDHHRARQQIEHRDVRDPCAAEDEADGHAHHCRRLKCGNVPAADRPRYG